MGQSGEATGGHMAAILEAMDRDMSASCLRGPQERKLELFKRHLPMSVVLAAADVRCKVDATIRFEMQAAAALHLSEADLMAQHARAVLELGSDRVGGVMESLKVGGLALGVLHANPPRYYEQIRSVVALAHEQELSLGELTSRMLQDVYDPQAARL